MEEEAKFRHVCVCVCLDNNINVNLRHNPSARQHSPLFDARTGSMGDLGLGGMDAYKALPQAHLLIAPRQHKQLPSRLVNHCNRPLERFSRGRSSDEERRDV